MDDHQQGEKAKCLKIPPHIPQVMIKHPLNCIHYHHPTCTVFYSCKYVMLQFLQINQSLTHRNLNCNFHGSSTEMLQKRYFEIFLFFSFFFNGYHSLNNNKLIYQFSILQLVVFRRLFSYTGPRYDATVQHEILSVQPTCLACARA